MSSCAYSNGIQITFFHITSHREMQMSMIIYRRKDLAVEEPPYIEMPRVDNTTRAIYYIRVIARGKGSAFFQT